MGRDDSVCSRPYYIIVMVFMHTYVANVIALLLYVHFYEPAPRPPLSTASAPPQPWVRSRLRPEGVKVGFVQALHLGGGVDDLHICTLSLKPLLFEIPKFLSHEDTRLLIALAQLRGLRGTNSAKFQQEAPDTQYDGLQARLHLFQLLDRNQDGKLQPVEVCDHVHLTSGLWLTSLELLQIYNTLGIYTDVHGCVEQEAFLLLTPSKLWTVLNGVWPQEDSSLEKYARSTWLQLGADAHQLLQAIWTRLVRASRLPPTSVGPPQALQVLRFDIGAKYHTHGDVEGMEGSPKPPPCESPTHFKQWEQDEQAPPRYITAILYLTNITEGGETVFPVADNRTYNAQDTLPLLEASHACKHGNLRISPQAGSLLLWYNYLPDGKGWVGEQDEFALHTGCPVKQGMKWIAVARIGLCLPHGSPETLGSHSVHQAKEVVESELNRKPETSLERKVDGEVEPYQGAGDDSSLNGITLICTSEDNQKFFNIMSAAGQWGCWTQPQWCPSGYLLAFRMQVESSQGAGDDTSANNIDFRCTDGSMLMGQGSNFGTYGSWSNDCGGKAICGLRTKVEEWTTAGDDTALNDVQFYCCDE